MPEDLGPLFFEVHRGLPREGPGSTASTLRALELARPHLPPLPRVVDLGCGPGAQTRVLADALPDALVVAVDLHPPFLVQLAEALGTDCARVELAVGDMATWAPQEPVDLVWCEGAAYVMGVPAFLERWRAQLRPGGCVALTEAVWLTDAPSPASLAHWASEYPQMTDVAGLLEQVRAAGLELLGHFVLPRSDWLEEYYAPMQARLDALVTEHAGDPQALTELAVHQREIDVYREHGDELGYAFAVARLAPAAIAEGSAA